MPGSCRPKCQVWMKVTDVWWQYIIIAAVLIFGVYCFWKLVDYRSRAMSRKSDRTAESMYDNYADSHPEQRRYARKRGGEWKDEDRSMTP